MFQNQLTVNIVDRDELQKKLHKYKEQVYYRFGLTPNIK